MIQVLVLSNISIEALILSIVVLLCFTTFGINVFVRQQIISQKQAYENRIQELHIQILEQQTVSLNNAVEEQEYLKRQKTFFHKMDIIKAQCLHLYQLTKQLHI